MPLVKRHVNFDCAVAVRLPPAAPVGVLMWASVSPEVEALLSADEKPRSLPPADWKSGDTIWLMEMVGEQQVMSSLVQRAMKTSWKDRTVKMRITGADGRHDARVLQEKRATH